MIEISAIKWYILAIIGIFVILGLLMIIWAVRTIQAQNTYRKLLNVSIDNEKRTNLGIQSEKELNKFLFDLLKDLVSPADEKIVLYKVYNLRAILTIMEIDHDRMKAFHYIKDTIKYPDSKHITEEIHNILDVHHGDRVLEPETRSSYERFQRAIRAMEYLERDIGNTMEATIDSDKTLDRVINTDNHVVTTTPIQEIRAEDNVKLIYRNQQTKK